MTGFDIRRVDAGQQNDFDVLKKEISHTTKEPLIQGTLAGRERALALAMRARPLLQTSRSLLFHGTRYPKQILRENVLRYPPVGSNSVHFSRDLIAATYFALLPRGGDDEGVGAILVLDRDQLAHTYRLGCFRDGILDDDTYPDYHSEADEIIHRRDVTGLRKYLIDTIWIDESVEQVRSANQVREERKRRGVGELPRRAYHLPNNVRQKLARMQRSCHQLPSVGQQETRRVPGEVRSPRARSGSLTKGAERSAIANVRTVFRDLEHPALQLAVLGELAARIPLSLAEVIVRANKSIRNVRRRRRKGPFGEPDASQVPPR